MLGPTAAGKSEVATAIARRVGGAIVSVDSMQVYREMDVGTAKPSRELRTEIPHRMIDIAEPEQAYSVAEFQRDGRTAITELEASGHPVIVAGGSGLHFRALVDPFEFPPTDARLRAELESADREDLVAELLATDPGAGDAVDLHNLRRVIRALEIYRLTGETPSDRAARDEAARVRAYTADRPLLALGLDPGPLLANRISERFDAMLESGLVAEVRRLEPRLGTTAIQAVGYKELVPHLAGVVTLSEARDAAVAATTALAKRQRTFFGRDPRIRWLPWHDAGAERIRIALDALEEMSWIS